MDSYASGYQRNQISSSIDPYYSRGDVFQRDQRYYDQTPVIRRSRTPNKGNVQVDNNSGYTVNPVNPGINNPSILAPSSIVNERQQLERIREQNRKLRQDLQNLTYGGQYGTGDTVIKMGHYTASKAQNEHIGEQERKIRQLQQSIKRNNDKLLKYQKASKELQIRINNIQSIDKQIYKQLKGASTRDRELLDRANAALARGESKETVLRILEQIILN